MLPPEGNWVERGTFCSHYNFISFLTDKLPSQKLPCEQETSSLEGGEAGGLQEQPGCCWSRGGWPLASLVCCLKNSRANNLNYSPASPGVGDDAFVYLNPDAKAKIVFCLRGHMAYRHWRNKQPAEGQLCFLS